MNYYYRPARNTYTDCDKCGKSFKRKRHSARFCSTRCRVANHRQEKAHREMLAEAMALRGQNDG